MALNKKSACSPVIIIAREHLLFFIKCCFLMSSSISTLRVVLFSYMALNKKSACSPVIIIAREHLLFFIKCCFLMSSSISIFSKLVRIKILDRLQLLQYGKIFRDRQTVFIINNSCIVIIHIGK